MTRLFLCHLMFTCVVATATPAAGQNLQNIEYERKATFFRYFGVYVKWVKPADPTEFVIGVLGRDNFGADLTNLTRYKVGNRRITIRKFDAVADIEQGYKPCDILFVSRSATVEGETIADRLSAALKATRGKSVLVVAEAEDKLDARELAKNGAHISFYNDYAERLVKMFINNTKARAAGFKVSSRLLQLKIVTPM